MRTFTCNIWDRDTFRRDYEEYALIASSRKLNMYVYRCVTKKDGEYWELTQGLRWVNPNGTVVYRYPINRRGDIIEDLWHPVWGTLEECKKKLKDLAIEYYDQEKGSAQDLVEFINKFMNVKPLCRSYDSK